MKDRTKLFGYRDISEWLSLGCDMGVFRETTDPRYAQLMLEWIDNISRWKG